MIRIAKTLLPLLIVLILIPAAVLADAEQEMSADEQAMMMAWMKAATPGEAHAAMADHTGSWKATMKSWMPGATEPSAWPRWRAGRSRPANAARRVWCDRGPWR